LTAAVAGVAAGGGLLLAAAVAAALLAGGHHVSRKTVGNRPTGLALVNADLWIAVRESGQAHRGGTLVEATVRDLDYVDPAYADDSLSVPLIGMTNDGLTAYKHVGGAAGTQVVPDHALFLPTPPTAD
jgi:hypothetical protein